MNRFGQAHNDVFHENFILKNDTRTFGFNLHRKLNKIRILCRSYMSDSCFKNSQAEDRIFIGTEQAFVFTPVNPGLFTKAQVI